MTQSKVQITKAQWDKIIAQTKQATGYTPDQIKQNEKVSGIKKPDTDSFQLKAEELIAIQQLNSKGFRIFDLNTQVTDRENYYCCYDGQSLRNINGVEIVDNLNAVPNQYYDLSDPSMITNSTVNSPYWRSIFIPIQGNFLKVEYLPERVNVDNRVITPFNPSFITDNSNPQNTNELNDFSSPSTFYAANKTSSDRVILLDFTDVSPTPIIAKHGDSFESYFNGVWVTFKQNSPRIRITIGFNSKVVSQADQNQVYNLNLWSGHGLKNNPQINPVPFAMSSSDVSPAGYIPLGTAVTEWCLVANPESTSPGEPSGAAILFLTSFLAHMITDPNTGYHILEASLRVKTLGTPGSFYLAGSLDERKLCTTIFGIGGGSGVSGQPCVFAEPVRCVLRKGTGLYIQIRKVYDSGGTAMSGFFALNGYSMGPLYWSVNRGVIGPGAPFFPRYKYTDNPYPIDFDAYGMPQF